MKYLKLVGVLFLMFFVSACSSSQDEVEVSKFYTKEGDLVKLVEDQFPTNIGNYYRMSLKLETDPTIEFSVLAKYNSGDEEQVIYFVKNPEEMDLLDSLKKAKFVKAGDLLFFEGLNLIYFPKGDFDVVLLSEINPDYLEFDLWVRENFELDNEIYEKINISREFASLDEFIEYSNSNK
ncbi:MAG: hypothetical protein KC589_01885 [Nanoarchaeota archaeon]|nr:hypothetical protein [Nanoarchaeota archaeon]